MTTSGSKRVLGVAALWLHALLSSTNVQASDQNVSFITRRLFEAGRAPHSVAVGDFNGDNLEDLAVANDGSSTISILLGKGHGTFEVAVDFPAGTNPSSIVVDDFNGDGVQDLALVNRLSTTVSVLFGNGDGTFREPMSFAVASEPRSLAVGDFNRDGAQDLAVATVGAVSLLFGNGDGTFQPEVRLEIGTFAR